MQRRQFIFHALVPAVAGAGVCGLSGCGALFQSERCGRPHSNEIDWKIAALDGLGLLLFFVPGVIAFVVDFSTGAIYLPIEQTYPGYGAGPPVPLGTAPQTMAPTASNSRAVPTAPPGAGQQPPPQAAQRLGLKRIVVPREQLEPQNLQQVVSNHVGRDVSLGGNQVRLSQLARLDQFDEQLNRHRSDRSFGFPAWSYFSQLTRA